MWFRLFFAAWGMALVHNFPQNKPLPTYYFLLVILSTVLSSFAQCVALLSLWFILIDPAWPAGPSNSSASPHSTPRSPTLSSEAPT